MYGTLVQFGCYQLQHRYEWKIYGALVQFGCYHHRYEWKDLWCSSTVRLLLK